MSEDAERFQASMGIYIFNRELLESCMEGDSPDFGKDIIPETIEEKKVYSYVFNGYWEDIGTIKSFYEANLSLTKTVPSYNFFDAENPIYTPRPFPSRQQGQQCGDRSGAALRWLHHQQCRDSQLAHRGPLRHRNRLSDYRFRHHGR